MAEERLIAVIDDDDSFRAALVELLRAMAYGAHGFASAEAFVATTGIDLYDCIITDIHMPGMSGIELKLLLTSRDLRVPVIMITARAEPGLEDRVTSCGALQLLKKPVEADVLIGCLERALRA